MKVTFFNENPPGTVIAPDAFKKAIGQKVPIRNTHTGEVGEGTLLDVRIVEGSAHERGGIEVTYETDMNLGISINFPMRVEKTTARMMFPRLAQVEQGHTWEFCKILGDLGDALDYIDYLMQQNDLLKTDLDGVRHELSVSEQQWDEHSCMEGHVCE